MVAKEFRVTYDKTRSLCMRFLLDYKSKSILIRGIWIDRIKNGKRIKSDEYRIYHTQDEWEEFETVGPTPEIPTFGRF